MADELLDLDVATDRPLAVPSELPILPLRDTVLFPNSFMPLAVAREASVRLIDDAMSGAKLIGVVVGASLVGVRSSVALPATVPPLPSPIV